MLVCIKINGQIIIKEDREIFLKAWTEQVKKVDKYFRLKGSKIIHSSFKEPWFYATKEKIYQFWTAKNIFVALRSEAWVRML